MNNNAKIFPQRKSVMLYNLDNKMIQKLAGEIYFGKIVIIKTDTVYGIVTNAFNIRSVKKVFEIKKRNYKNPFILLINDFKMLKKLISISVDELPLIVKNRWPGPTTFLLPASPNLNPLLKKDNRVAVRHPNNKILNAIMEKCKVPLVAPSANIHGEKTISKFEDIVLLFNDRVDYIVSGSDLTSVKTSTIIDVTKKPYSVLR